MKVSDAMTNTVVRVRANDSLSAAAQLMWERDCGAVPVVDETTEQVIGMITDRDICMATWSQDRAPSVVPVSEAMSREVFVCAPWDSLSSAEELMRLKQIRRLPVTDGQNLVGILSLADIVTKRQNGKTLIGTGELAPSEIVSTLANICQPRHSSEMRV